jgi:hypothetical protein
MPSPPPTDPSSPSSRPRGTVVRDELLGQTREALDAKGRGARFDQRARTVQVEMARELMRAARRRGAGRGSRT